MELAPAWMSSYTKEVPSSQGTRYLGKERERVPKYGRQLSFSHLSTHYSHSSSSAAPEISTRIVPFACSITSPPPPPHAHAPASILGEPQPRVLNRSKSSPGFGSPKSNKQKKSPDRVFSSFKSSKQKPPKQSNSSSSYLKSLSQPNLFDNDKTNNWQKAQKTDQSSSQASSSNSVSNTSSASSTSTSSSNSSQQNNSSVVTSISPIPPSSSPPPILVPEIDKLKNLVPSTATPPKSVRPRVMVGPPLPLAKKAPAAQPLPNPSSPVVPSGSTANGALTAYFRKATSEPSLMHHKAPTTVQDAIVAARRAEAVAKKIRNMESEKAQAQLMKENIGGSKQLSKRNNFFQHVIKQEEQGAPIMEDDSPIGIDNALVDAPFSPTTPPPPFIHSVDNNNVISINDNDDNNCSTNNNGIKSPLPEDMEDEERFLRTLGWVPDEEDPVPVLAEEEIRDVRVKIFLSRSGGNGGSGDNSGDNSPAKDDVADSSLEIDVK